MHLACSEQYLAHGKCRKVFVALSTITIIITMVFLIIVIILIPNNLGLCFESSAL